MREALRRVPLEPLVRAFFADCRARRLSPRTLEHYAFSIASYRRSLGLDPTAQTLADLDLDPARAWAASLGATRNPASVGNAIAGLKVFSSWLVREDHLRTDPLRAFRKPRTRPPVVRPLSLDQARLLIDAAPAEYRIVLECLLDTGLRLSEAVGLRVGDVGEGHLRVLGKGGRERVVPCGVSLEAALRRYLSRGRPRPVRSATEALFLTRRGAPIGAKAVQVVLRRLGRELGLVGVRVSPHTIRHTMATEYLRLGGGELALQRILGHADLAMVGRYAEISGADLVRRHAEMSPLDACLERRRGGDPATHRADPPARRAGRARLAARAAG